MSAARCITQASEVTEGMLVMVANCAEDWFPPEREWDSEGFIDRLCTDYLNGMGYEIEQLDTPAVRKILRHARSVRREMA